MAKKERVFKIDFGNNSIIYIAGDDDIVTINESGIYCTGEEFEDKKVYCTKTLLMDIFGIAERSIERYAQKKIIRPEPERIDRKQVFDFFQSCYNLLNYKQAAAREKGENYLPSANDEEVELVDKRFAKAMEQFDRIYEEFCNDM